MSSRYDQRYRHRGRETKGHGCLGFFLTLIIKEVLGIFVSVNNILYPEVYALVSKTDTHRDGEERRILVVQNHVVAQQSLALEHQVSESVTQLSGKDTDTSSRHDVAYPVAVVKHTHNTCCCCNTVAGNRIPG